MEILGHSQIALTMNTYRHVAPEVSREAADRMARALWSGDDQAGDGQTQNCNPHCNQRLGHKKRPGVKPQVRTGAPPGT
jgi:hypothetical protein